MSYVTSVTVVCPYLSDKTAEALTAPLPFDEVRAHQALREIDMDGAGGYKGYEGRLFAAGFNYLDVEAFREWITAIPWNSVEWAVVVSSTEGYNEQVYTVGHPPPR